MALFSDDTLFFLDAQKERKNGHFVDGPSPRVDLSRSPPLRFVFAVAGPSQAPTAQLSLFFIIPGSRLFGHVSFDDPGG